MCPLGVYRHANASQPPISPADTQIPAPPSPSCHSVLLQLTLGGVVMNETIPLGYPRTAHVKKKKKESNHGDSQLSPNFSCSGHTESLQP